MGLAELGPYVGPIIVALITAAGVIYGVRKQAKKDQAEVADKISQAWERLIKPYREEMDTLHTEIRGLKVENMALHKENTTLWAYIRELREILERNCIKAPDLPNLDRKE